MHSVVLLATLILGTATKINCESPAQQKDVAKRSTFLHADEYIPPGLIPPVSKVSTFPGPWLGGPRGPAPSPAEVSNTIAAAKQASTNVLIAQQQVQAAKENVFNQQRIAMEKEANAAILTQKSETAAALQRSEAASAAQGVILAHQRLAAAKAAVAHQQRIAAAKEAEAAAALQSSAQAAAAEIHRSETEAAKLANLQRIGAASIAHHVTATKDAIVSPLSSGNNNAPNIAFPWPSAHAVGPWVPTGPAAPITFLAPAKTLGVGNLWG